MWKIELGATLVVMSYLVAGCGTKPNPANPSIPGGMFDSKAPPATTPPTPMNPFGRCEYNWHTQSIETCPQGQNAVYNWQFDIMNCAPGTNGACAFNNTTGTVDCCSSGQVAHSSGGAITCSSEASPGKCVTVPYGGGTLCCADQQVAVYNGHGGVDCHAWTDGCCVYNHQTSTVECVAL